LTKPRPRTNVTGSAEPFDEIVKVPSYLFNDFGLSAMVTRMLPKCPKLSELYIIFPAERWTSNALAFTGPRDAHWPLSVVGNASVREIYFNGLRLTDFPDGHGADEEDGEGEDSEKSQARRSELCKNHHVRTLELSIDCDYQAEIGSAKFDKLCQAVSRFPQLQHLAIHVEAHGMSEIWDNHRLSWSGVELRNLRHIALSGFSIDCQSLQNLLCSGEGVLKTLSMCNVWLCDLGWARIFDGLRATECDLNSLQDIRSCNYSRRELWDEAIASHADFDAWDALREHVQRRIRERGESDEIWDSSFW
jgi:hypothetical protein